MPSSQSFLKLETMPMVKNVNMKNMTRKTFASPVAALVLPNRAG